MLDQKQEIEKLKNKYHNTLSELEIFKSDIMEINNTLKKENSKEVDEYNQTLKEWLYEE